MQIRELLCRSGSPLLATAVARDCRSGGQVPVYPSVPRRSNEVVVSGMQCIDYSSVGNRKGVFGESGKDQITYLEERRWRRSLEAIFVVEEGKD